MNTANLNLEKIILEDTINSTMLEKTNNNMQKLDVKYGELKNALLEQTGKSTLAEAIAYVQTLANHIAFLNSSGNAIPSQILAGKEAVVKGVVITGTIPSLGAQTITPRNIKQNNIFRQISKRYTNNKWRCKFNSVKYFKW